MSTEQKQTRSKKLTPKRKRRKPIQIQAPYESNNPNDIHYVYHPTFSLPNTEKNLWGDDADEIEVPRYNLLPQVEKGHLPEPPKKKKRRRTSLGKSDEKHLFLQYNYAKYRLVKALKMRSPQRRKRETATWRRRARIAQEKIIHGNLPLVPAMAQRRKCPTVEFTEMVSEGYMAVMRSVEHFDVSYGYKFSTYACRAILACFHRLASKTQRYRQHVPVQFDPELERSDYQERRHEIERDNSIDTVRQVLSHNTAELSDVEARVIGERFPMLSGKKGKTLAQVGKLVGLSNERVRQIESRSLSKLRGAIEELSTST